MFARVQSGQLGQLPPEATSTFVGMIRDQVIPRAQGLEGLKGGYWLLDRGTGRVIGITLWETKEALEASAAEATRIREESSRGAGLPVPSVEEFEVIGSIEPSAPEASCGLAA